MHACKQLKEQINRDVYKVAPSVGLQTPDELLKIPATPVREAVLDVFILTFQVIVIKGFSWHVLDYSLNNLEGETYPYRLTPER